MEGPRPPKPRLTIRVGVTGHRLEALRQFDFDENTLRSSIREVLTRIQISVEDIFRRNGDVYSQEKPVLRIISPLAEGSDQFVAQEGIAPGLGYELHSPLPFAPKAYKESKTFTEPGSRTTFDQLFGKAKSVMILDDSQPSETQEHKTVGGDDAQPSGTQAYETLGRVVLRQSDLLIAIWNGTEEKGQGGTGQVVREALAKQIPVIWISASKPHSPTILTRITEEGRAESCQSIYSAQPAAEIDKGGWLGQIKKTFFPKPQPPAATEILDGRIREILEPPGQKEWKVLQRFLRECQPEFRAAFFFRAFCRFFVPDWPLPEKCELEPFERHKKDEWTLAWEKQEPPNHEVGQQIEGQYRIPFLWADVIGDICSDRHRSSFTATYLLGALAVLAAFLGSHKDKLHPIFSSREPHPYGLHGWFLVELVFIIGILALVLLSRLGRWHDRWMDYRLLAEGLRQMRVLALFARVTPSFEAPAHLLQDATNTTWFNWYFRATVRQAGLLQATVDRNYLKTCRDILKREIQSQIDYHKDNEERNEELHTKMHALSIILFLATLAACILHLPSKEEIASVLGYYSEGILTFCAIVFPAFGAAIQGILSQSEAARLARRSGSIRKRLQALLTQIDASNTGNSFKTLGRFARSFSEIQIQEQTDWRSVFRGKDVKVP